MLKCNKIPTLPDIKPGVMTAVVLYLHLMCENV